MVKVKLNLAFFDVAADQVIAMSQVERWAIGGHSLGGVAAAIYAKDHLDTIRAIVFWASYPADDALKNSNILVLSIHGSHDGLATGDKINASKTCFLAELNMSPLKVAIMDNSVHMAYKLVVMRDHFS